jgi:hypothetical protein
MIKYDSTIMTMVNEIVKYESNFNGGLIHGYKDAEEFKTDLIDSINKDGAKEKPNKAPAVISTLTIVTFPVPNLRSTFPLNRLDIMVPPETVIEIIPAVAKDSFKSSRITGQVTPNKESGNPRLINAK